MFNSSHFTKIVSTLPNPDTRYKVCPRIDFDKVGCIQHAYANIFKYSWPKDDINRVLTFARVTAIGNDYYPNSLNFTLINVYVNDNYAIQYTEDLKENRAIAYTVDCSDKLATFLHVVLNDTVDQKLKEVADTLFIAAIGGEPKPTVYTDQRIQTPIIFVEGRKVKEKLDMFNSYSKDIFEKQYSIDGQNCPDICFNHDMKWYENFLYTHSIHVLDSGSRSYSKIRAIEIMNGAYIHWDLFGHNDDYKIESERINDKILPLFDKKAQEPLSLIRKLNEFFREPRIITKLPRYPVNDGWNAYSSTVSHYYIELNGMPTHTKKTSSVRIDWKRNALKSVRERSMTFGYVSEYDDDGVIENASEDARYNFTNYNNWVIEKNKFPYDLYLPH